MVPTRMTSFIGYSGCNKVLDDGLTGSILPF
jgi:hypothetical protein